MFELIGNKSVWLFLIFILLTEIHIKTTLFYGVASCSLVDSTMTLEHRVVSFMLLKMKALYFCETIALYQVMWCHFTVTTVIVTCLFIYLFVAFNHE